MDQANVTKKVPFGQGLSELIMMKSEEGLEAGVFSPITEIARG